MERRARKSSKSTLPIGPRIRPFPELPHSCNYYNTSMPWILIRRSRRHPTTTDCCNIGQGWRTTSLTIEIRRPRPPPPATINWKPGPWTVQADGPAHCRASCPWPAPGRWATPPPRPIRVRLNPRPKHSSGIRTWVDRGPAAAVTKPSGPQSRTWRAILAVSRVGVSARHGAHVVDPKAKGKNFFIVRRWDTRYSLLWKVSLFR
jgi:hypothetical protein